MHQAPDRPGLTGVVTHITTWQDLMFPGAATDFFRRRTLDPFEPSVTAFRRSNAVWLAELSRIVYRHDVPESAPPSPTRSSYLAAVGLRQRGFFASDRTGTQAMLVESVGGPAFAVLVFRGTETGQGRDVRTDLQLLEHGIGALPAEGVHVHEGFRKALESVWSDIETALAALECPCFYAGHSLGAALATLAAARRRPTAVFAFGSPRVGNAGFVESLAGVDIHRVVDDLDLVTRVPFKALNFAHAGQEHVLAAPKWHLTFDPREWIARFRSPPKPLADHAPVNYVDRL